MGYKKACHGHANLSIYAQNIFPEKNNRYIKSANANLNLHRMHINLTFYIILKVDYDHERNYLVKSKNLNKCLSKF